jgi:hypothetical protein
MDAYVGRFDIWQVLLTLVPLVAGVTGALLATRWTQHLGKIVIGYSLICIGVGLSPQWLPAAGLVPPGSRPVLVETKVMFILGILAVLAAAGRAVKRGQASQRA